MKKTIVAAAALLLSTAVIANAQSYQTPATFGVKSSPNVVGSGARALGVGGAFIAIADDGTAASWNPAALIILERPEAALMASFENRKRDGETNMFDFNYIAASYPFVAFKRNMVVSFNYQRLFDFNSQFNKLANGLIIPQFSPTTPVFQFRDTWSDPPREWNVYDINTTTTVVDNLNISDDATGDCGAVAPAFAIQITPKLSAGITLNFWTTGLVNDRYGETYEETQSGSLDTNTLIWFDTNDDGVADWDEWTDGNGNLLPDDGEGEVITTGGVHFDFASNTKIETEYELFGINANIGVLYKINQHFNVGAVYKLPYTADVKIRRKFTQEQIAVDTVTNTVSAFSETVESEADYDLRFPTVVGLGAAYRMNDNFTASLDVSYTDWPAYTIRERWNSNVRSDSGPFGTGAETWGRKGAERSGVNGLDLDGYCDRTVVNEPCYGTSDPRWRDNVEIDGAITARLGLEYLFILPKTIVPARLGFVYDPQPALGSPDNYFAVTTGTGVVLFDRLVIDLAYQYRWGNNVTLSTVTSGAGDALMREYTGDVRQHIALLSTIYHF